MKRRIVLVLALLVVCVGAGFAQNFKKLKATLIGYEEPPPISTTGKGAFEAQINNDGSEITYKLSYSRLESSVTQAHIHFGQRGVNGGISAFLCANNPPITTAPPGTPPCPASPGTVTGTIVASDVIGPGGQGIAAGELAELIRAIRNETAYVNVHSSTFPGGEVRGQIDHGEATR